MIVLYNVMLLLLIILAVAVVAVGKLRIAAIAFGLFSVVAALCYLMLAAPDVALAEAIIGSTISTIIFLVGIRKYRVCTVCILPSDAAMESKMNDIIDRCTAQKELEPHYIHKHSKKEMEVMFYDIGYELRRNRVILYGEPQNYLIKDITDELRLAYPNVRIDIHSPSFEEV